MLDPVTKAEQQMIGAVLSAGAPKFLLPLETQLWGLMTRAQSSWAVNGLGERSNSGFRNSRGR
jgi:hypothetical protein